jgi:hypothetical protein
LNRPDRKAGQQGGGGVRQAVDEAWVGGARTGPAKICRSLPRPLSVLAEWAVRHGGEITDARKAQLNT